MARKRAGLAPFGIGETKPQHFRSMLRIVWDNLDNPFYAWKVLNQGTCDGCALGTIGMKDWTLPGGDTHLCMVRLELLRLNTIGPIRGFEGRMANVEDLAKRSSTDLRNLGRIPLPMRWKAGEPGYRRISWDEFFEEAGARVRNLEDKDRFALYLTSRGITNETYYVAQKTARFIGTNNVDNSARLCHSPSTAGLKSTLGVAATTCSYRDWYDADLIVFIGSNPANDQPVSIKYLLEAKKRGATVITINTYREPGMDKYWVPSDTESAVFGDQVSDAFFLVHTGGDLAFLNAVQKRLIETGRIHKDFIEAFCENFDELEDQLTEQDLDRLIQLAGTTREALDRFVDLVAGADKGVLVWSMGVTQHAHGADTVRAIANLGLLKSWVGRDGCGLMPIRGHSGVQGGAEMGAYATVFPGGQAVNPVNAQTFTKHYGFEVPSRPGLSTTHMIDAALNGNLDVFYIVGGNFLETLPQPARVKKALENVPVRIHQDIVLTSQMMVPPKEVSYILPARTRYEQRDGGTETTTERRVILSPEIPGHDIGEAMSEWEILMRFGEATDPGRRHLVHFDTGMAIRTEIGRVIPLYARMVELRQPGDQFQWGGPHLCPDGQFPTDDGKAHFVPVQPPELEIGPDELRLSTRRGKQFNSMVQGDIDPLTGAGRQDIFISEDDAHRLGFSPGQPIVLENEHGSFHGLVCLAPIRPGNIQGHWPEVNVLLPADRLDPGGLVPDYNAVVRVSKPS